VFKNSAARRLKWTGAAVAAAATVALATSSSAYADSPAPTAGSVSARTDPAVVLVETDVSATIRVAQPEVAQAAVERLTSQVTARVLTGQLGSDQTSVVSEILRLIEKAPDQYFTAGPIDSIPSRLSSYGTGFIVTPDGYVVTAAHVVSPDQQEVRAQFARYGLQREAEKVAASNRSLFAELDKAQVQSFTETILGWQSRHMSLVDRRVSHSAQLGIAVAGFDKTAKGVPVTMIGTGSAYPGRDVAIVKLGGNTTSYPTVPVGTDADVQQGDTLFVDGYPAASTFFAETSKDSQLQPSTTSGEVTAIKTTDQGTAVLQSQAPITPGNSGGPVLDAQGRVVGLVAAAAVDSNTGTQAQGQNFFIAASVINNMLDEHNVKPAMSLTSQSYNKAVTDFDRQYYKSALQGFEKAQNLYPGHPYAGHFISQSQSAISAGKDRTPKPFPWPLLVAVGAGALLVIGLVGALLLRRRRPRGPQASGLPGSRRTGAGPNAAQPVQAYPPEYGYQPAQGFQPGYAYQPAQGFQPGYAYQPGSAPVPAGGLAAAGTATLPSELRPPTGFSRTPH
jgi:serine protease Do